MLMKKPVASAALLIVAMLLLLAACAGTPATLPTSLPPTSAPATPAPSAAPPASAPATLPPTPAPATPAPTAEPTLAPPAPTVASESAGTSYLIYQSADGSLLRSDGPGRPPATLTSPSDPTARLPWAASPNGKTIAVVTGTGLWYQFKQPVSMALWLVGADGANPRKIQDLLPPQGVDLTPGGDDAFNLVPALTSEQQLAWSPDGQLVAFVSAHEGQVDLYTAALDGTVARISNSPKLEQGPRWSADGALLAYRTTSGFGSGAGWGEVGLELAPRAGGAPVWTIDDRQLSSGAEAGAIPDLLWLSPNLLVAGFWDRDAGASEIRALNASEQSSKVIWSAPYSAIAWNSATTQLAIAGSAPRGTQRKLAQGLFTWAPDAAQPTQIDDQPVEQLAWSPQGDALAYSVSGKQSSLRIWSIGIEGDIKRIGSSTPSQLSWSNDGQRLATGQAIYSRSGEKLADQDGIPIGWVAQSLVYAIPSSGEQADLWLWDDTAAQAIATGITGVEVAAVVVER